MSSDLQITTDLENAFVELSFAPNVRLVPLVRNFVSQFYEEILRSNHDREGSISRLAVATHELLENAIKYAEDGRTRVRIETVGGKVVIRTWNRARASHAAELRVLMRELTEAADPLAFYQALLVRTLSRSSGSGLGLGRVRAEAEMRLALDERDGEVCVIAEADIGPR